MMNLKEQQLIFKELAAINRATYKVKTLIEDLNDTYSSRGERTPPNFENSIEVLEKERIALCELLSSLYIGNPEINAPIVSHGMGITYLESETDGYPNILTEGKGWLSLETRAKDLSFVKIMKEYYQKQGHEKMFGSHSCSVLPTNKDMMVTLHGYGKPFSRNTRVKYKIYDWEEKICK